MTNEKMREEFEETLWREGIPPMWIVSKKDLFEKDGFWEYKIPYVQGAWFGYQAAYKSAVPDGYHVVPSQR